MNAKNIIKFLILAIISLSLINAWLPSTSKTKILSPLYESLKAIENLQNSIGTYYSNVDNLKSESENISLSDVPAITNKDIQTGVRTIFQTILTAPSLSQKDAYLTTLTNYKSSIDPGFYTSMSNRTEQLYDYKEKHIALTEKLPEYKNQIDSMPALIKKSAETSQNQLDINKANPKIDQIQLKKESAMFPSLTSKLLDKTNLIAEFDALLIQKSIDLTQINSNLLMQMEPPKLPEPDIAVSTNIPVPLQTNLPQTTISSEQMKNLLTKEKQMMELSKSLLSPEMQKGIELIQENKVERAQEIFKKEIEKDPNNWMARKYLAKTYLKEKRYDEALKEINIALEIFQKQVK